MHNPFDSSRSSKIREDGTHPAFPPGFKFCPSDQIIVNEFLMKRASNKPLPDNPIKEMNVYLYNPQDLPVTILGDHERWMYFFIYMDEGNISRTTPDGYWKLVESDEPIKDEHSKEIVAFKNTLVYYTNEAGANGRYKTNWTMEEFRLSDVANLKYPKMKYWVLCKIQVKIPPVYESKKTSSKKEGRRNKKATSSRNVTNTSGEETALVQRYDSKEKENVNVEEIEEEGEVIEEGNGEKNKGNGERKALKLL